MIKVLLVGHDYEYEIKELLKLFYDVKDIQMSMYNEELFIDDRTMYNITNHLKRENNKIIISTKVNIKGKKTSLTNEYKIAGDYLEARKKIKHHIKADIFKLLKKYNDISTPWGLLTGIRPTKIVHELMEEGFNDSSILHYLMEEYFIVKEKALLLLEVAKVEHGYIYPIGEDQVSIYISIPFCPTRCVYCSFPSNPLDKWQQYMDAYIVALNHEIKGIGQLLAEKKKTIETIYIGGGTPTTLNIGQFQRLFHTIYSQLNTAELKEFTVEAGRPDTIDREKLMLLKSQGVTRISINPQTMNDCTLKEIGRNHTVGEIANAYGLAEEVGFTNINMDIIIGLPGEDLNMVSHTMDEIEELAPSSLTVHTLAIKNASKLKEEKYHQEGNSHDIIDMLRITEESARKMGLRPYYMYRQKHMVGNLENVGYAKEGKECIYNIQIMEEKQSIIGAGAGAVTKFIYPKENRLERVPNIKNLEQYIQRVDEMIERKKQAWS